VLQLTFFSVRGYNCTIRSTIPINAGTGSSSALVVAWIALLLTTQEHSLSTAPEDIARYAHRAEVIEFGEPGGMMDHYTAALGGVLYMQFGGEPVIKRLPARIDGLVLGNSLVPKPTAEVLRRSRQLAQSGFDWLAQRDDFHVHNTGLEQVAQLINRDLCQQAYLMLTQPSFDPVQFGQMLLEHQRQLREGIGVSHPKLDRLINESLAAGAVGGKLNGSGCGGAMFAYAPGCQQQVKTAIDAAGGRGYITVARNGVTVEVE